MLEEDANVLDDAVLEIEALGTVVLDELATLAEEKVMSA